MSWLARLPKDRTLPLLALVGALVLAGVLWRSLGGHEATAPAPCPYPVLVEDVLRCDGADDGDGDGDGEGAPIGSRAWLAGQPLDLNAASQADLERLPGVGAGLARRIVEARAERGGFRSVDELDDVRGIGAKTLAKLKPYLTVSAQGGR